MSINPPPVEDDNRPGAQPWAQQEEREDAPSRSGAGTTFWLGVVVFVAAAVVTYVTGADGGGVIWYGGMAFGALLLFRAFQANRNASKAGAPKLGGAAVIATAVGLVAVLGTGALAVTSVIENDGLEPVADSCWKAGDDDEVVLVSCSRPHDYKAVKVVKTQTDCPDSAVGLVNGHGTDLLCLEEV